MKDKVRTKAFQLKIPTKKLKYLNNANTIKKLKKIKIIF